MAVDVVDWAQSAAGFYVDRHWTHGHWALKAGPIRLAEYQARILRHVLAADADGRLPYDVVAWCEPAKSGKSAIAALVAEYCALHLDGDAILASNKQDQAASIMYRSLAESVTLNPHLKTVPARFDIAFRSGNMAKAIPSNARGEAGARFSCFVLDEPWGVVYEDARRLWDEFKTDPTRRASLKLAIGYAGYRGESLLWEDLLTAADAEHGGEPVPELADLEDGRGCPACWRNGRHFTFWSHRCQQPWQTADWIASQRRQLRPPQYARMIETDFAEGEGQWVDIRAWDALIDRDCEPLGPWDDRALWVGLDAGTKHDAAALVACTWNAEKRRVELVHVRQWRPEHLERHAGGLDLEGTLGAEVLRLKKIADLREVAFDPWQLATVANQLQRAQVRVTEMPQTAQRTEADQALYDSVVGQRLAIFDSPELRDAVLCAAGKETDRGYRLTKRTGDDLVVALSMAHWLALSAGMQPAYGPPRCIRYA